MCIVLKFLKWWMDLKIFMSNLCWNQIGKLLSRLEREIMCQWLFGYRKFSVRMKCVYHAFQIPHLNSSQNFLMPHKTILIKCFGFYFRALKIKIIFGHKKISQSTEETLFYAFCIWYFYGAQWMWIYDDFVII